MDDMAFDPVTLEIFWSRLISITDRIRGGTPTHLVLDDCAGIPTTSPCR